MQLYNLSKTYYVYFTYNNITIRLLYKSHDIGNENILSAHQDIHVQITPCYNYISTS